MSEYDRLKKQKDEILGRQRAKEESRYLSLMLVHDKSCSSNNVPACDCSIQPRTAIVCPECKGPTTHDREYPPNPYVCDACDGSMESIVSDIRDSTVYLVWYEIGTELDDSNELDSIWSTREKAQKRLDDMDEETTAYIKRTGYKEKLPSEHGWLVKEREVK